MHSSTKMATHSRDFSHLLDSSREAYYQGGEQFLPRNPDMEFRYSSQPRYQVTSPHDSSSQGEGG